MHLHPGALATPHKIGPEGSVLGGRAGCRAGGVSAPGSRKLTPAPSPREPQPCPCHGSPEDGKAPDKVSTPARPQLRPASSSTGKGPSGGHWAGSSGGLLQAGQGRSLRPRGSALPGNTTSGTPGLLSPPTPPPAGGDTWPPQSPALRVPNEPPALAHRSQLTRL